MTDRIVRNIIFCLVMYGAGWFLTVIYAYNWYYTLSRVTCTDGPITTQFPWLANRKKVQYSLAAGFIWPIWWSTIGECDA